MMSREQKQQRREMRKNVINTIQEYGFDCMRTYIVIDHYRCNFPKDERFIEVIKGLKL